jgi:hypothetical protein
MKITFSIMLSAALGGFALAQVPDSLLSPVQERVQKTLKEKKAFGNYAESFLRNTYNGLAVEGQEQAYLDTLGTSAAEAITLYRQLRALLVASKGETVAPDLPAEVYVLNEDGTVTYVAPPEPVDPEEPADP